MQTRPNLIDLTTTAETMVTVLEANYMTICRAHGADSAKAIAARDSLYSWELVLQACRSERKPQYIQKLILETVAFHA